jgi:hypothetical protein
MTSSAKKFGRPTKYRSNYPTLAQTYFDQQQAAQKYPSVAGLAVFLSCAKSQIYEWGRLHEDFQSALDKGKVMAERMLMEKALDESWNPGFTKFLMVNNHDMVSEHNKLETNNTHNFPSGISITFIDGKEIDK